MADIRALLRAERANRGPEAVGKKRKAGNRSTSSPSSDTRKRVKSEESVAATARKPAANPVTHNPETPAADAPLSVPAPAPTQPDQGEAQPNPSDDLEAFDRELAELEAAHQAETKNNISNIQPNGYSATISAAPLTAEQIAAQAREEQSSQRGKRDQEIEAEKEDAESALREEMEEMAGLEERVRRLRERREAVRTGGEGGYGGGVDEDDGEMEGRGLLKDGKGTVDGDSNVEDGQSDDEEEEKDAWAFGGS
ncbi:hypothetical protein LTR62_003607 [Meristemomyces frigidus]|uniref:Uncharacterized protein n=1 Tax=Meristemomyces frigidus TaxID=1508187 RepID=A0AAN7YPM4_9PEZI|nr:hypothetical protein LTR62_003607 [Meristemomyces frigidus]